MCFCEKTFSSLGVLEWYLNISALGKSHKKISQVVRSRQVADQVTSGTHSEIKCPRITFIDCRAVELWRRLVGTKFRRFEKTHDQKSWGWKNNLNMLTKTVGCTGDGDNLIVVVERINPINENGFHRWITQEHFLLQSLTLNKGISCKNRSSNPYSKFVSHTALWSKSRCIFSCKTLWW